ncbi:NYN domain-containing protein [Flaviflexus huanghaiensis]|uniref:NYN domain-containing protein n=1 Tax=Flaviflexus huanghaiensis TaxID=1111473 RepID=UPI0015FB34FC|nr:NYN domain-containing protein [Flaviflexus huanghaiensis]
MFTTTMSRKKTTYYGNRRAILADLENVIGGAAMTVDEAAWGRTIIELVLDIRPDEQVIVGACGQGHLNTKLAWSSARVVGTGHGPDAADDALIEVLEDEQLGERFSEIVLVTGDHGFAEKVRGLVGGGTPVTVASWRGGLSPLLVAAASGVIILDEVLSTYVKAA